MPGFSLVRKFCWRRFAFMINDTRQKLDGFLVGGKRLYYAHRQEMLICKDWEEDRQHLAKILIRYTQLPGSVYGRHTRQRHGREAAFWDSWTMGDNKTGYCHQYLCKYFFKKDRPVIKENCPEPDIRIKIKVPRFFFFAIFFFSW